MIQRHGWRYRWRWVMGAVPLMALAAVLVGCHAFTDADVRDESRCPQTYEFGNFGCARVVALVQLADQTLPRRPRIEVRLQPLRANTGWEGTTAIDSTISAVRVVATLMLRPLPGGVDTISVWVVAHLRDASVATMPVVASDSVQRLLRFVPVGATAIVDSVPLRLRSP